MAPKALLGFDLGLRRFFRGLELLAVAEGRLQPLARGDGGRALGEVLVGDLLPNVLVVARAVNRAFGSGDEKVLIGFRSELLLDLVFRAISSIVYFRSPLLL